MRNITLQDQLGWNTEHGYVPPQPDNCPIGYQGQHGYEDKIVGNPFNIPIYHKVCTFCGKDKDL